MDVELIDIYGMRRVGQSRLPNHKRDLVALPNNDLRAVTLNIVLVPVVADRRAPRLGRRDPADGHGKHDNRRDHTRAATRAHVP
jgi:hypothetical protein